MFEGIKGGRIVHSPAMAGSVCAGSASGWGWPGLTRGRIKRVSRFVEMPVRNNETAHFVVSESRPFSGEAPPHPVLPPGSI